MVRIQKGHLPSVIADTVGYFLKVITVACKGERLEYVDGWFAKVWSHLILSWVFDDATERI